MGEPNLKLWAEPIRPDWIWSSASNAHVAKDLRWFTDYTPFITEVRNISGERLLTAAIGTVDLPTKCGSSSHKIIRLQDVLYIPDAFCNIVSGKLTGWRAVQNWTTKSNGYVADKDDFKIALLQHDHPLLALRLSGPPRGPILGKTAFEEDVLYLVNVFWDDLERQRWKCRNHGYADEELDVLRSWSYSDNEKAWLRANFRGESRFLRMHSLNIHDEEDRCEGRQMVREMIAMEEDARLAAADTVAAEEKDSFASDLTNILDDVLEQAAWFMFTEKQQEYMVDKHGGAAGFMRSRKLKFYNPVDYAAAMKVVSAALKPGAEAEKRNARVAEVVKRLQNLGLRSIFTPAQRRYIERRYERIEKFMERFSLDATNDDDCEEAKAIVTRRLQALQALQASDEETS